MENENELIKKRKIKLKELENKGINPYPYKFNINNYAEKINEKYSDLRKGQHTKKKAKIAGRITSIRRMGKATFMHLLDHSGKIQLYFRQDDLGKEFYKNLKFLDMGDFLGVEGVIFKTKMGEVTISVSKYELLCKSLRPLPEKYHGLKDTELRYRQRYLDLIMNPEVKEVFVKRSKIISAIKEFLDKRGFLEVETPILQPIYGGANARPFITKHNTLKMQLYLRISDELYLKRLIVGGFDKIYEISKNFRNEGIDKTHNPEFTMMECYWSYADYNDMMNLTENMYIFAAKKVLGTTKVNYQGRKIDFKKPWKRLSMHDAIKKYAKIDVEKMNDSELDKFISKNKIEVEKGFSRGLKINALFEALVEDKLIQPVFIIDYPKETSPLCKKHRKKEGLIERFELFINGWECGNAYSELNDPEIQKNLLKEQAEKRAAGDEEANPMDEDFVKSLEYGMPPTGGLGIGVDRLIMLLTNSATIRDVMFFPVLRKKN
jgi:lysyl-tRNA synthetase class 2